MSPVSGTILTLIALCAGLPVLAQPASPFEAAEWSVAPTALDVPVLAALRAKGLSPARPCSDAVFIRRVYLDMTGTLPDPSTVRAFLADTRPGKRGTLIEALFARGEFADYWALKWCDVLRVKAEFPSNLWPNAVQAYHQWLRVAVRDNRPYDQFVRELLTSSGSNFRVPPVNFYRASQGRDPAGLAETVALTFMGTRLASWQEQPRTDLAALFSRVRYKKTGEWKEEIVYPDLTAEAPLEATLPDGTKVTVPAGADPRVAFADWLLAPQNPWFARCAVNRVWAWLMGRGIIHEPDDIRPDNPPSNPELLAYLERELVNAEFDLRHIFRLILNSLTYQQSPIALSKGPQAEALFASYPVRRLEAEVLIDALDWIGGTTEVYSSAIPEPFTFIPEEQRTIALADGSITSSFLQMFGRPPRDTGLDSERNNQMSDAQRLYLLNSADVQRRIARSPLLRRAALAAGPSRVELIREVYLALLSREPTLAELRASEAYYQTAGLSASDAATDLAWALINTMEFLYRH